MTRTIAFAAALFVGFSVAASAREPYLTELKPIPLQSGINQIPGFTEDGRNGMIVLAWRENGNAHGYDLALVLTQAGRSGPWDVVRREGTGQSDGGGDEITDNPHTGDDMVRAFRFARGRVNGKFATLLLIATRDPGDTIPEPSRVTFDTYRLDHDPDVGTTPDHFTPIARARSTQPYCNADLALSQHFGLPLRASYEGGKTPDGC